MTSPSVTRTATMAVRAHAAGESATADLVGELRRGLAGRTARAVLGFASPSQDLEQVAEALQDSFPGAEVIGCSTAGEFTDGASGSGGLAAIALPEGLVVRAAGAIGNLDDGVDAAVEAAVRRVEQQLGAPLRDLDPERYVGFVLIDGLHGDEEAVNEALGKAAPLLNVVGGSAGDDLSLERTWVAAEGQTDSHGFALLVVESGVPFRVVKTCSFTPSGKTLTITSADVRGRRVLAFDGKPAAQAYAEALGIAPGELDASVWMSHPVGLMIDGEPWIRSPQTLLDDGSIRFYAQILEGMEVDLMNPADLIGDTAAALAGARASLGGASCGAVLFNCILRRLELDSRSLHDEFTATFAQVPTAGFHTYGESWLGHINQTLTGVVFGAPGTP